MSYVANKTAVITGGSRGIGYGLAKALLSAGARVLICSRTEAEIDRAVQELSSEFGSVAGTRADVAVEADVKALFAKAVDHFGTVDILVNNAGNFDGGPLEDLTLTEWNHVLGACLTGPFLCTREAFRIMKPRGTGRVLNIGSISAQRARMNSVPYTSAKFGVQGLTHAAALEGRDFGITVGCLHPGNVLVERRQQSDAASDQEAMMSVETIVRAAMAMLDLPDDVNFLDAIVLPARQDYIGRG